jgi:hypothetical protein
MKKVQVSRELFEVKNEQFTIANAAFLAQKAAFEAYIMPIWSIYDLYEYERKGSQGTDIGFVRAYYTESKAKEMALVRKASGASAVLLTTEFIDAARNRYTTDQQPITPEYEPETAFTPIIVDTDGEKRVVWVKITDIHSGIEDYGACGHANMSVAALCLIHKCAYEAVKGSKYEFTIIWK